MSCHEHLKLQRPDPSAFVLQDDDVGTTSALGALTSVQEVVTLGTDPIFQHAQVITKVRAAVSRLRAAFLGRPKVMCWLIDGWVR